VTPSPFPFRPLDLPSRRYSWIQNNTPRDAVLLAWPDHGPQIATLSNRTVVADSTTWNTTHIAAVGRVLVLPEEEARHELHRLGATYVLVVFGGKVAYSNDDLAKLTWMVRSAKESGLTNEHEKLFDDRAYFAAAGEFRIDSGVAPALRASLLYRLSYYRFAELFTESGTAFCSLPRVDATRVVRV
jgi:dolichyl-diphosphooligosaccharide--protein glycosyltransferase